MWSAHTVSSNTEYVRAQGVTVGQTFTVRYSTGSPDCVHVLLGIVCGNRRDASISRGRPAESSEEENS